LGKINANNYVDYQERAKEFSPGDVVVPFGVWDAQGGRVTAVWPAIGMADVEFSSGNRRFPVEDLQRISPSGNADPPTTDSAPGGQPTVQVPGGPSASKVARAFSKKSIYWAAKNRQYKMTRPELDSGSPCCPKCGSDHQLGRAIYKRRDGSSERLLGCKNCLFLIKEQDIVNVGGA